MVSISQVYLLRTLSQLLSRAVALLTNRGRSQGRGHDACSAIGARHFPLQVVLILLFHVKQEALLQTDGPMTAEARSAPILDAIHDAREVLRLDLLAGSAITQGRA